MLRPRLEWGWFGGKRPLKRYDNGGGSLAIENGSVLRTQCNFPDGQNSK